MPEEVVVDYSDENSDRNGEKQDKLEEDFN